MAVRYRPMRPNDAKECVEIVAAHPFMGPRYGSGTTDLRTVWPLVPFAITAKLPAAIDAGTESVTAWLAPAATTKGDAGDVVPPTGRPDSEMDTEPVKPFCPVTDTLNVEAMPPACCATLLGEIAIAKS